MFKRTHYLCDTVAVLYQLTYLHAFFTSLFTVDIYVQFGRKSGLERKGGRVQNIERCKGENNIMTCGGLITN